MPDVGLGLSRRGTGGKVSLSVAPAVVIRHCHPIPRTNKWRGYERHQKTRPAAVSENRYALPVFN